MAATTADRARSTRSSSRAGARTGRGTARAGTAPRVRWDKLGRMAMLVVLTALLYLYLSAGMHMFSTWGQSRHDKAAVATLEREHRVLARQHEALGRQNTIETEARQLGMKKANERAYVINGLPSN